MTQDTKTARSKLTLIVERPWEPGTFAIVTAELFNEDEAREVTDHVTCFSGSERAATTSVQGNTLRDHIKLALSHWFTTTDAGREAWESSADDFNIGDLCHSLGDEELEASLRRHGIAQLTIDTYSSEGSGHAWTYDEVLATDEARAALDNEDNDEEEKGA
jgi:hypothetical protein